MTDASERIKNLMLKHLKGELNPLESDELQFWVYSSDENRAIFDQLSDPDHLAADLQEYYEAKINIRAKIDAKLGQPIPVDQPMPGEPAHPNIPFVTYPELSVPIVRKRIWFYAAAAALLLFLTGVYILYPSRSPGPAFAKTSSPSKADVAPGGNRATLTLGDGSTIVLDSTRVGTVTQQGASLVKKLDNGQLAYYITSNAKEATYNTISTPIGGQYQVTLPDNSKVWLNAGSSLRFPTAFNGKERNVEITGEAYFEIARNTKMPFRVKVNDTYVSVLGTHFNIMAYKDEPEILTTLLEGSVKVSKNSQAVLLSPGQQARVKDMIKVVKDANTDEAIAWKNGLFEFNSADIETVMRTLARWYNVDVKYQGAKTSNRLTGLVRRDSYVSDVLQILAASGYHFKIEGNTIVVLP